MPSGAGGRTGWTPALTMLIGRFAPIVLALAIVGSLAGARVLAGQREGTTGPSSAEGGSALCFTES